MKNQSLSPTTGSTGPTSVQLKLVSDLHILSGLVREDSSDRIEEIDPRGLAEYLLKDTTSVVEEDFVVLTNNFSERKKFMLSSLLNHGQSSLAF